MMRVGLMILAAVTLAGCERRGTWEVQAGSSGSDYLVNTSTGDVYMKTTAPVGGHSFTWWAPMRRGAPEVLKANQSIDVTKLTDEELLQMLNDAQREPQPNSGTSPQDANSLGSSQ